MRKKLLALAVGAVVLSVSACGGKTENRADAGAAPGTTTETQKAAEKSEKSGLFEAKESEAESLFSQISLSDFGNVGNDPNNLNNGNNLWGIAFDEEHIYFNAEQGLFMTDYSGENVVMLNDAIANKINLYGDYIYYVQFGGVGCRYHLKTGETETFMEKVESKDLNRSGKTYDAYHTVDNFFIVDDYLFYTEAQGYKNTSEGASAQVNVIDLTDMAEYTGVKNGTAGSYTTDGTYVYSIGGAIYKIALDEIKNGKTMEEVVKTKCEYDDSLILGSDGFYCADDEDDTDKYYVYKFDDLMQPNNIYGKRAEVLDIETIPYPGTEIVDNKNFIIGDTFFSLMYNRTLYYYKGMDFSNPQSIEGFERMECAGCYNDRLYLVDHADGNMRLTTVDADGNYTQTALIPEVVEEEEVVVGEYNEYNTYFTTEVPPAIPAGTEITYPENATVKRKMNSAGVEYIEYIKEENENGDTIKETYFNSKGVAKYSYEWSPDMKEERYISYNEDGTVEFYILSTTDEEHTKYYTKIKYSPERKELERSE